MFFSISLFSKSCVILLIFGELNKLTWPQGYIYIIENFSEGWPQPAPPPWGDMSLACSNPCGGRKKKFKEKPRTSIVIIHIIYLLRTCIKNYL